MEVHAPKKTSNKFGHWFVIKKEKHTLSKLEIKGNNFNIWCFIIVNIIINCEILETI